MSITAAEAAACRRLWASVLLAALDDFNRDHSRASRPDLVLARARRYFVSRDGRQVASMAGVDVDADHVLDVIALPRDAFRRRLYLRPDRLGVTGEDT
ncbi:hypothetical protein [Falsirhodobacter halotolerans]|uniref:hypothetical protein n=1 Tax=Falsirhodobacter halotolerans TaxID=1146892 RepID=UPI001FD55945|nr:hypothetical protein [Falsirhodobacter halotolerans]MCJ8138589.1 hypothetical protein [Falsirhodobacter halotolerans]